MSKEKKINVIGMDVFQTAAVKRNYANVKPLIKERNKMVEKIADLSKKLEIKKAQIAANDQHTGMITKETCGIALTSEQVMWFLAHPEEFADFKAAHGLDNTKVNTEGKAEEGTEEKEATETSEFNDALTPATAEEAVAETTEPDEAVEASEAPMEEAEVEQSNEETNNIFD